MDFCLIHEHPMNIIWKSFECETTFVHIPSSVACQNGDKPIPPDCGKRMFFLTNARLECYIVPIPDDAGRTMPTRIFRERRPWLQAANAEALRTPPADGDAMRALQR